MLFEWKITDLGNGEFGHVWISRDEEYSRSYRIFVDPTNVYGHFDYWAKVEDRYNTLGNCELPSEWFGYKRILAFWQSIGAPIADREAPGYTAAWFPWLRVGFTVHEAASFGDCSVGEHRWHVDIMIDGIPASELVAQEDAKFEKAAEAAMELESE